MTAYITKQNLKKINDNLWEISKDFRSDMRVPARVYASEKMLDSLFTDRSLWQLVNTATMQGAIKYSIAMPDIHEGYGFPIGGVVAMRTDDGLISPGGIGYDINCGVRLLKSDINFKEAEKSLSDLATAIYKNVPSGVGKSGYMKLGNPAMDKILNYGAQGLIEKGYGISGDAEHIESDGRINGANPDYISSIARKRGHNQLGTLGAGNHFVEIQRVDEIFDEKSAEAFGLSKDQLCIMIHTGSRGFGHQIATDYIRLFLKVLSKYNVQLPDRELAAVPIKSDEGEKYLAAMAAGANFAFANRQLITHMVRKSWEEIIGKNSENLTIVYDVAHNIGKIEKHKDGEKEIEVLVHRKGATRAFPANHPETPTAYKNVGQPVLIPGSMGTASYVLVGAGKAMEETFGSSCHGAGRIMSRTQAKREVNGSLLKEELKRKGIIVKAGSMSGLAEEAPTAYKDVDSVVDVVHNAGIAKKVARLRPLAVIKG